MRVAPAARPTNSSETYRQLSSVPPYQSVVTSMKGWGYQCTKEPRISVNPSQATGKTRDHRAIRAEASRRGPNTSHPTTARIGTVANSGDVRLGFTARSSAVTPTTGFASIVKNEKVLKARSTGV